MILTGRIVRTVFRNKENSYTIYKIELENGDIETITGNMPVLSVDTLYEFEVTETTHPTYGVQYKVESFNQVEKQNKDGLIKYLSSELFTGIGPKRAEKIVNRFGDDAISKIIEDKNILKEINFTPVQIERLYQELLKESHLEIVMKELFKYDITLLMATKLYNTYGKDTLEIIKENPYRTIDDIHGISFKRADELARKLGFSYDHPTRIEAGLIYALETLLMQSGNTYVEEKEFSKFLNSIISEIEKEKIDYHLENLIKMKKIIFEQNTYTIPKIKDAEVNIAKYIKNFKSETVVTDEIFEANIKQVERILNINYTDLQKEAIKESIKSPISIITGGPGTGKTTVLSGVLMVYARLFGLDLEKETITYKIGLCAPTGRASRRMEEVMDVKAFTIHKLLGYDYEGIFHFGADNPLPQDLIIIDEGSMIDIFLMEQLLSAIMPTSKVIIVGDKDQLPSVGPGQVLEDIILSGQVKVIELTEIHRQAKNSHIIEFSNEINHQTVNDYSYDTKEDLIFMKLEEPKIINTLIKLTEKALEEGYDLYEDMQVLIPIYKGRTGIDAVNKEMQDYFIKDKEEYLQYGSNFFYVGDKVIQLTNDPKKNIMNGDIGVIKKIVTTKDDKYLIINFSGMDVEYERSNLENLSLAYAISVHKSQGSEYKIVYMPLVRSYSHMLRKELLYTGVTRAKAYLYLLGELQLAEKASKILNEKRKTRLKTYLQQKNKKLFKTFSPYEFL